MKHRIRIALGISVLAVLAAGCGTGNIAATVNGVDITQDQVLAVREGTPQASMSGEEMRADLTRLMLTRALLDQAEEEFGLVDLDTDEARNAYLAAANPNTLADIAAVASDPSMSDVAINMFVTQLVLREQVRAALAVSEDVLQFVWQEYQPELVQICARHILVPTEDEAKIVADRLSAGEDFATVAGEVSLDTGSPGGALPCPSSPSNYVDAFAATALSTPIGELSAPVETQFGWHVILVDSLESPANLDELAANAAQWVPLDVIDAEWSDWLNDVVEAANISVRSDIGMWYPPVKRIVAPPNSP